MTVENGLLRRVITALEQIRHLPQHLLDVLVGEMIEQGSEREVTNVTLDVRDKNEFDPEEHHFIFLTERLIREETYSKGDQKIWIEGDGRYSGPLAKYVDNWDVIFQHATETSSPSSSTPPINGSGSGLQGERIN